MTARNYDVILSVSNTAGFVAQNTIIGNTSAAYALIANVDHTANTLKVKLSNALHEFSDSEAIHSNVVVLLGTANGALQTSNLPFQANIVSSNTTTAITTITGITPSPYIAEKNAFTQNPVVRLYEIYYPGEWYPPNAAGNPTGAGAGRAWPSSFPFRFADVRGDFISDLSYNVTHRGDSYIPFPLNVSSLEQGSDGKINEVSLEVYNLDNLVSVLVEDPYLVGNCTTNSVVAVVNGEEVHGIDPRTVDATPADVGSVGDEAFDTLTRARANGLAYSTAIVGAYGKSNASFTKEQCDSVNGTWEEEKIDTRDLLGGVVTVKTTFANFLDFWPEYSSVRFKTANVLEVLTTLPYRVGDNVVRKGGTVEGTIQSIEENRFLYLSNELDPSTAVGSAVQIVNADADADAYIEDIFKIDQLESLDERTATFGLVSWLQYFKNEIPRRKFYKNTCQWVYKGEECQYPGPGGLAIPNTTNLSNTNPIAANNQVASSAAGDVCGKSLRACELRGNEVHFGGFPGTGRTVPTF